MAINSLRAFYYESFPIEQLTYFDIPTSRTEGVKTGGMGAEEFQQLVDNISEHGMINPVYVEDDNVCLRVQLGNNRVIAMKQLGHGNVRAVIITKGGKGPPAPGSEPIPLHKFDAVMERVHPGDTKYRACRYARNIRGAFRQEAE